MALDVSGSIEYTGTITDVSDERLKENIRPLRNSLSKINSIEGVSYNMIGDSKREIGVMAQDVLQVFPEAVSIVDPENGHLGVSYTQLIPVLLEAIKEQQIIIEQLQVENAQLSSGLQQIREMIGSLGQNQTVQPTNK